MKTTSAERMRKTRRRRRFGMKVVTVEMPLETIELLEQQGYLLRRSPAGLPGVYFLLTPDDAPAAGR
jgi:hypothetical protein